MKRLIIIGFLASVAWSADFSHMSTEEMMNIRGSVPVDDRPSFQNEMQKRMQSMSPEEREKYMNTKGIGQRGMNNQPTFVQFDLNNDGKITPEELEEGRANRMKQNVKEGKMMRNAEKAPSFADLDRNKDGTISQEEFRSYRVKHPQGCITFG